MNAFVQDPLNFQADVKKRPAAAVPKAAAAPPAHVAPEAKADGDAAKPAPEPESHIEESILA